MNFWIIDVKIAMGKKSLRKRIASLSKRIAEHELKVMQEKIKGNPNYGLIRHWEIEIAAFSGSIERARKRMKNEKTEN